MSAVDLNVLQRPHDRLRRRRLVNRGMEVVAWLTAALAVFILGFVIFSVAQRGWTALNLDFFTKSMLQFSTAPQGLLNAFVGTFIIVGIATLMALPVGILIAIYVNEFAPKAIRNAVNLTLDVLAGVPAIVIGLFVFQLIVVPTHHQSGYAGAFALAVIMLPLVSRSTIEVLALVPDSLREAALGVGAPRWRTTVGVVLPQTIGGVLTGAVLAVARVAGETAPLLIVCSLVLPGLQFNPSHPLMTVPLAIYQLVDSADPADYARAWAAALVLIVFILVVSLTARWFSARSRRKMGLGGR